MIIYITFVVVVILLLVSLVVAWDKIIVGKVPFIVLPPEIITQVLDNITIEPGQTVYDLGCGDGRVLLASTKKQPKASYVGIEKAIWPYILAKYYTRKIPQISIYRADITKLQLQQRSLVICYLLPELLGKIAFSGQSVVSIEYKIPNHQPSKEIVLKKHSQLVRRMFFYKSIKII